MTSSFSFVKPPHSYFNLRSPNWLSSEVVTSPNPINATTLDCNLILDTYIIEIFKILFSNPSYFNLFQWTTSYFHLLFCCNSHLTYLPKKCPTSIHILIHILSKLIMNLQLAFPSSTLVSNTSFQVVSFLLTATFYWSLHHTFFGLSPPTLIEQHTSFVFNHCTFHLFSHVLEIIFSIPFYSLPPQGT